MVHYLAYLNRRPLSLLPKNASHWASAFLSMVFMLMAAGCVNAIVPDDQNQTCNSSTDCPGIQLCQDNLCQEPSGCETDADCPTAQRCIENGRCRANVQCIVDADCCPAGEVCTSACEDYICSGDQCETGSTEDCFIGCHRGTATCAAGLWQSCNAPPIEAEICGDNIDNDCQNGIDDGCEECTAGQTQECDLGCGIGTQECGAGGLWQACNAPRDCLCEGGETQSRICGNCGLTESICVDGQFVDGECSGEGLCAPGSADSQACGNCGVQTRDCTDECSFGEWSACEESVGACTPDEVERRSCSGGGQMRICDATCGWSEWSECDPNGGCTPGETQTQTCGNCGERSSTCDAQSQWGAFGACTREGVCTPQEVANESCGNCGERSRICSDTCQWQAFGTCENEGVCSPNALDTEACGIDVGICTIGDRSRTCSDTCQWQAFGECSGSFGVTEICGNGIDDDCDGFDDILPDFYEPNNDCVGAYDLGTDPIKTVYPTYDNVQDRDDFFKLTAIDNTTFGDEEINILLTNVPEGMDLDLFLFKGLTDCEAATVRAFCGTSEADFCQSENNGNSDESLKWVEQNYSALDPDRDGDGGEFYILVRAYNINQCYLPYTLSVNGLHVP